MARWLPGLANGRSSRSPASPVPRAATLEMLERPLGPSIADTGAMLFGGNVALQGNAYDEALDDLDVGLELFGRTQR